MEIRLIKKSGVPAHEIDAHQKIYNAFNGPAFSTRWLILLLGLKVVLDTTA